MSLEALFRATREGLPGARARFFEGVYLRLRRHYAGQFSADDTKDLAQETMVIVLERLDELSLDGPFEGWLIGVARNVANRELETRGRQARLDRALENMPVKPPTGPNSALLLAEHRAMLLEEIQQLPESMRVVIEHDLADGDPAALADAQQVSRITLRTRRNRATDRLTQGILARCEDAAVSKLTDSSSHRDS